MLMVEQNVSFTLGIADRVLVMQKGEIVYEGDSAQLDRERLAELLGIGALLGSKVLAPDDIAEFEPDVEPEPLPLRRPRRKAKPAAKSRTVRKGSASRKPAAAPARKTAAKKPTPKRKPPTRARKKTGR